MPNSLFTGVSGLLAHQRRLDIVANNLANLNTTAYKANRGVFADTFYESVQPASGGNGLNIGGTNPAQIGTGVKVAQIKKLFSQGNLETTGQPLDFALDGEGFFVVSSGDSTVYTRAGSFSIDADNYLVDPHTGAYVQRFGTLGEPGQDDSSGFQIPGDQRIHIPIGSVIPGQPTETIDMNGILNSEAVGPQPQILTSAFPMLVGGTAATGTTLLNDLDSNSTDYIVGDSIDLSGETGTGAPFSGSFAVGPTTTVDDLLTEISALIPDGTASVDANGNLSVTADADGPSIITLEIDDATGNTGVTDFERHRLIQTQIGKGGDTFTGVFDFYDGQGAAHGMIFEFEKIGVNNWNLELSMDPSEGVITGGSFTNILFNDDGSLHISVDPNQDITAEIVGVTAPQVIDFSFEGIQQLATDFEILPNQDGFAPSELISAGVDIDGALQGITSNGQVLPLARLAIATFANNQGLNALGGGYYSNTLNSGLPQVGAAVTGGRAAVRGGQLESSNVDTAYEFTQLIVAQRGFSANARTISVADEVLEELTNIIR